MLKNHSHGTMEGLEKYKLRLKSLTVLVDKMQNGTLSILELSELEELTRELHERSIILKYKAFEEKVGKVQADLTIEEISMKKQKNQLSTSKMVTMSDSSPPYNLEQIEEMQEE